MKSLIPLALLLSLGLFATVGCKKDESGSKVETMTSTPEGETTTTTEHKVEKSGDNPPAAPNP